MMSFDPKAGDYAGVMCASPRIVETASQRVRHLLNLGKTNITREFPHPLYGTIYIAGWTVESPEEAHHLWGRVERALKEIARQRKGE